MYNIPYWLLLPVQKATILRSQHKVTTLRSSGYNWFLFHFLFDKTCFSPFSPSLLSYTQFSLLYIGRAAFLRSAALPSIFYRLLPFSILFKTKFQHSFWNMNLLTHIMKYDNGIFCRFSRWPLRSSLMQYLLQDLFQKCHR